MCGFLKHILSVAKPIGEIAAAATGNPELVPLIEGGSDLASGQGIGKSLTNAGIAFGGQEIGGALGNLFPETLGSTLGTAGNSLTDALGYTSGAGSLFGAGTLGGDISGLFNGAGGASTFDSGVNAARGVTADAAISGGAQPLAGVTGGSSIPSVGGGSAGGFVNAPDVGTLGDGSQIGGLSLDTLNGQTPFSNPSTSVFANASSTPLSDGFLDGGNTSNLGGTLATGENVSSNNNPMINGLLRSGLTSLFTNTNQSGYNGENAAAQKAAQAYQPFLANGTQASNTLASLFGNNGADQQASAQAGFANTPGYQFARDQGLNAVTNSAAAKGNLLSGNAQKALQDYGTGLANQTYQQYVSNLQNQAGQGVTAAGGYGSSVVGGANALAQGGQAQANNQNQGIGGALSSLFPGNDILSLLRGQGGQNSGILSSLFS